MGQVFKYIGIGTKITVMVFALVVVASCAVGFSTYWRFSDALVQRELNELSTLARVASTRCVAAIKTLHDDVEVLAELPAVGGIARAHQASDGIDPIDGWSERRLRNRLANAFSGVLRAKPQYTQIRYIGVADGGRELVRVDRSGPDGRIRVVAENELQQKGQRPCFQQAIALPAGRVWISEIDLNREGADNRVSTPYVPVIRAATPVYTDDEEPFGVVVINRFVAPLFDEILQNLDEGQALYIANDRGDYLLHPDPARTFGFEFGTPSRIQDEFPALGGASADDTNDRRSVIEESAAGRQVAIGVYKARSDPNRPERFLAFALSTPYDIVVANSREAGSASLLAALAVLLPALAIGYAMSRSLARPLQQIAVAAGAFGRGESDVALPLSAGNETGIVARALSHMRDQVRERTVQLESENAERRRAERDLETANHELAAKTAEIQRYNARLSRSNDELKQFAYVASHDLQEPLRKVTSFCEMLRDEYGDRLDGDALIYIDYAVGGALRMKALVSDLLEYSRVETQGKPLQPTSADQALSEAVDNLEMTIEEVGAQVQCDPLPVVAADRI